MHSCARPMDKLARGLQPVCTQKPVGTDTPKRLFERSSAASLVGTQLKSSAPPERTAADYGLGRRTSVDHLGRHNTWMSDDGELNASGLPMAGHELPAEMLEDIKEAIGHQGARRIEAAFAKADPSKQGRLCPADFVAVLNSLREPDMSSITPAMLWGATSSSSMIMDSVDYRQFVRDLQAGGSELGTPRSSKLSSPLSRPTAAPDEFSPQAAAGRPVQELSEGRARMAVDDRRRSVANLRTLIGAGGQQSMENAMAAENRANTDAAGRPVQNVNGRQVRAPVTSRRKSVANLRTLVGAAGQSMEDALAIENRRRPADSQSSLSSLRSAKHASPEYGVTATRTTIDLSWPGEVDEDARAAAAAPDPTRRHVQPPSTTSSEDGDVHFGSRRRFVPGSLAERDTRDTLFGGPMHVDTHAGDEPPEQATGTRVYHPETPPPRQAQP